MSSEIAIRVLVPRGAAVDVDTETRMTVPGDPGYRSSLCHDAFFNPYGTIFACTVSGAAIGSGAGFLASGPVGAGAGAAIGAGVGCGVGVAVVEARGRSLFRSSAAGGAGAPAVAAARRAGLPAVAAAGGAGVPAVAAAGGAGVPAVAAAGGAGVPAVAAAGGAGVPAVAAAGGAGVPAAATDRPEILRPSIGNIALRALNMKVIELFGKRRNDFMCTLGFELLQDPVRICKADGTPLSPPYERARIENLRSQTLSPLMSPPFREQYIYSDARILLILFRVTQLIVDNPDIFTEFTEIERSELRQRNARWNMHLNGDVRDFRNRETLRIRTAEPEERKRTRRIRALEEALDPKVSVNKNSIGKLLWGRVNLPPAFKGL